MLYPSFPHHIPAISGWSGSCGPAFPRFGGFGNPPPPRGAASRNPRTTRAINKGNISMFQKEKKKGPIRKPSMEIKKKIWDSACRKKERTGLPFFVCLYGYLSLPPIPFLNGVLVEMSSKVTWRIPLVCSSLRLQPNEIHAPVGELSRYHGTLKHAQSDTTSVPKFSCLKASRSYPYIA